VEGRIRRCPILNILNSDLMLDKLVCMRGTIVRTSGVKPLATKMSFTCNTCLGVQTLEFPDARFVQPTKCHETGCRSKQFSPQRGVGYETETVDWQTIRYVDTHMLFKSSLLIALLTCTRTLGN